MRAVQRNSAAYAVLILSLFVFFNFTACTLAPKNPSESALMSTYTLVGVYKSIALLREADRITKAEGIALFDKANEAEVALRTARIALDAGDQATFAERMAVASRLLLAVEQQLNERSRGDDK